MRSAIGKLLGVVLPPVLVFAGFIAVWHLIVVQFDIKRFLLPSPLLVWESAVEKRAELLSATLLTAKAAATGLGASLIIGTLISVLFSQSILIRRALYPYALFLQTVPIVAVAPLIILWFGQGFNSIVVTSFIIGLFPIIANSTTGLTSVPPNLNELFAVQRATRWQRLWKLQLPNSIPYMVTGAKISSGLSVIGVIVGESLAGFGDQQFGLGYLVFATSGQLKTSYLFAAIICSTLLGLLMFGIITVLGDFLTRRWRPH